MWVGVGIPGVLLVVNAGEGILVPFGACAAVPVEALTELITLHILEWVNVGEVVSICIPVCHGTWTLHIAVVFRHFSKEESMTIQDIVQEY